MKNSRVDRLEQLRQLKEKAKQDAFTELAKAREAFNNHKERHDQLLGYRKDYVQQFEDLGSQGSSLGRLRNRLDFINHLDITLIQLNNHLGQLAKQRSRCDALYKQSMAEEKVVLKLIENINKADSLKLQRIEQKEMDEYAQKQWYSRKNETN